MRKMVERQSLIDKLTKKIGFIDENKLVVSPTVYIEDSLEVENEIMVNGGLILEGVALYAGDINHYNTYYVGDVAGGDEIIIDRSINLLYPFRIQCIINNYDHWYEFWYQNGHMYWVDLDDGQTGNFDDPQYYPPFCSGISVGNLYELGNTNCVITVEGQTNLTNVTVIYYSNGSDLNPHLKFQAGAW